MALTRSFLRGMGLTDDQISDIIEAHTESTEALKAQRDNYKTDADKYAEAQKELEVLKSADNDVWQKKYEEEHSAFEAYRSEQIAKETRSAKESAYLELLKASGVSEKAHRLIVNAIDMDSIELDSEGKIIGSDELSATIKTEYADFITSTDGHGADVPKPPENNNSGITKEAFAQMGYNDRLKLYNEQPELYKSLNE